MNQKKINPVVVFPENMNEIINKTIDEINLKKFVGWLESKKITINIKGEYILPNNEEIKGIVSDAIKQFYAHDSVEYFDTSKNKFFFAFDALIDSKTDDYYVAGICLKKRNEYFDFDFYLYSSDIEGQLYFETTYERESYNIIMFS